VSAGQKVALNEIMIPQSDGAALMTDVLSVQWAHDVHWSFRYLVQGGESWEEKNSADESCHQKPEDGLFVFNLSDCFEGQAKQIFTSAKFTITSIAPV
jgi:hypothetical protein